MIRVFFKGAKCLIFVYDVTNKSTYEKIADWHKEALELTDPGILTILVGNKSDRSSE